MWEKILIEGVLHRRSYSIPLNSISNSFLYRLDDLPAESVIRLIVPDVAVLTTAVIVFILCKVLLRPPAETEQDGSGAGDVDTGVYHRRQVQPSIVAEGMRSFVLMVLCGLVATILPSAISAFYFLSLLIVVTWWSFYKSWGSKFNAWMAVWLMYSGAHLILLYLYQFPFFQDAVPPEFEVVDSEDDMFAR